MGPRLPADPVSLQVNPVQVAGREVHLECSLRSLSPSPSPGGKSALLLALSGTCASAVPSMLGQF